MRIASLIVLATACGDNLTLIDRTALARTAPKALPCLPNLDGMIEAREFAPALDRAASYVVTEGDAIDLDLAGTLRTDGRRVWDWSYVDVRDAAAELVAEPLQRQWYLAHFPAATFSLPTDFSGRLHGLYSHSDEALVLYGFASAEEAPTEGKTLLVYSEPVSLFPFPLTVGKAWRDQGEVRNGVLKGLSPWSQDDTYEVAIVALGEVHLPDFTFAQALQLRTTVTMQPLTGLNQSLTQHQQSFVYECFGEVARASTKLLGPGDEDPGAAFTLAREVRRLGW